MLQHPRDNPDAHALAAQRTFPIQVEMILAQTGLCCLLLPTNKDVTCDPSGFSLKGSMCHK